jgi:hypothetical protein
MLFTVVSGCTSTINIGTPLSTPTPTPIPTYMPTQILTPAPTPTPVITPTPLPSSGVLKAGLPATMDYRIQVIGGSTPVTLSYVDLRAMDFMELAGVTSTNAVGTVTTYNFIGVPLMTIVNRAGAPSGEHSYKVTATDGYSLDYSQAQFNAGIVAFKTDGIANTNNINDKTSIILVIPGENRNTWLKMPVKIQII